MIRRAHTSRRGIRAPTHRTMTATRAGRDRRRLTTQPRSAATKENPMNDLPNDHAGHDDPDSPWWVQPEHRDDYLSDAAAPKDTLDCGCVVICHAPDRKCGKLLRLRRSLDGAHHIDALSCPAHEWDRLDGGYAEQAAGGEVFDLYVTGWRP